MSWVTKCRSCGAEIVWLKTDAGKPMPVDADEVAIAYARDGVTYSPKDPDIETHFATCPHSKSWSGRQRS